MFDFAYSCGVMQGTSKSYSALSKRLLFSGNTFAVT